MNITRLYNAIDLGLFYGRDYGGSTVNEHFLILGKESDHCNSKFFRLNNSIVSINWSIGDWSKVAETCLLMGKINVTKLQPVNGIIDVDEWMAKLDIGYSPFQFPYKIDLMRFDLQSQAIDLEFSDKAYIRKKRTDHCNSCAEITLLSDQYILNEHLQKFDEVRIEYKKHKEPFIEKLLECFHGVTKFDEAYLDGFDIITK